MVLFSFIWIFLSLTREHFFIPFRESRREKRREREKYPFKREAPIGRLLYVPKLGVGGCPGILPSNWGSYESCLDEIKPTPMYLDQNWTCNPVVTGWSSNQLSNPSRVHMLTITDELAKVNLDWLSSLLQLLEKRGWTAQCADILDSTQRKEKIQKQTFIEG